MARVRKGNTVFFPHMPKVKGNEGRIVDRRLNPGEVVKLAPGRFARPARVIGTREGRKVLEPEDVLRGVKARVRGIGPGSEVEEHRTGVMIPYEEFKPYVDRLVEEGRIDPSDVPGTARFLHELTGRLMPHEYFGLPEDYHRRLGIHGGHQAPLLAVTEGVGKASDRAAVFAAMARAAGLKTRIRGDPDFFSSLRFGKKSANGDKAEKTAYLWPEVKLPSGKWRRMPFKAMPRELRDIEPAGRVLEEILGEARKGKGFAMYEEYEPKSAVSTIPLDKERVRDAIEKTVKGRS